MSTLTRILIVAVVFLVVFIAVYIIDNSLGLERGTWRFAISIGVVAAATGLAWHMTAPKV